MNKLKPIIAQAFWILFGIALLLPVIGWFLGTGTMASTIDQRKSVIEGLKPQPGDTVPNDQWIGKIGIVEKERQERLETASDYLWDQQQKYMTWPASLGSSNVQEIASKTFEDDLSREALNAYRYRFDQQVEALRQIVEPYEYRERPGDRRGMGKVDGKVILPPGTLPLPFAQQAWPTGSPTSKEVWYLQEDIWLLRGLLEAVKDVNDRAGAEANIMKVPIKQVLSIELKGGNPEALAAAASGEASTDASAEGGAHGGGMSTMPAAGGGFGGMGGGEGMGGAGAGGPLDFDLAEEVGPAASVTGTGVSGEGDGTGMESSMPAGGLAGGIPGANPIVAEKRYVDDVGLPYKTRAFKMQVIMDHRQIPEFLAELTASPFPVRILRVHFAELNSDPLFAGNNAGGGYSDPEGGFSGGGSFLGGGARGASPMGGGRGFGAPMGGGRGFGQPAMPRVPMGGASRGGSMPFGAARGGAFPMGGASRGGSFGSSGLGGRGIGSGGIMMPGARPGFRSGLSTGMEGGEEYGVGPGGATGMTDLSGQALADPFLAQVVVGGLMTIYRSEKEIANAAEGEAATEEPVESPAAAGETPPADGTVAPADGTAPVDGATPDPVAPVDGAVPAGGAVPAESAAPADGAAPAPGAAPVDGAPSPDAPAPGVNVPAAPAADPGVATEGADAASTAPAEGAPGTEPPSVDPGTPGTPPQ